MESILNTKIKVSNNSYNEFNLKMYRKLQQDTHKNMLILLDFVEKWNKNDEDVEVAESAEFFRRIYKK